MEQKQTNEFKNMTVEELLSFSYFQKLCADPSDYGYGGTINDMRKKEYSRIGDMVFLDHVGTALFPESLLQNFMADLTENVYGNPHSNNLASKLTYDTIEHVRYRILQHFNTSAEDYTVIFTSGSTGALKLLADTFPWTPATSSTEASHFCYLTDNHTSVVGIRGAIKRLNVPSVAVTPEHLQLEKKTINTKPHNNSTSHLFCYPALSNHSGTKYPLSWIRKIKSGNMKPIAVPGNWFVLLDAASFVSTSPLDLATHRPDFVTVSFYKIFGFPTGLGALIVSNQVAGLLKKHYFGGGTAAAYLPMEDFFVPKESISTRFEDGTVSFLDIIALKHGFDTLQRLTGGMEKIKNHTHSLASYTYSVLSALRYANGKPVVCVYTDTKVRTYDVQGPVINFNVLDENGGVIGYTQVDKLASLYNIHFRTGCFCNGGACQKLLGLTTDEIKSNLQAGHVCGDDMDIINGRPTGSVRISFGFMSTFEDAQAFLHFIVDTFLKGSSGHSEQVFDVKKFATLSLPPTLDTGEQNFIATGKQSAITNEGQLFISKEEVSKNGIVKSPSFSNFSKSKNICSCDKRENMSKNGKPITLNHIFIYPIKSCAPFKVSHWPVEERGLLYDRNWMIVNENGVCLSQKQETKLCLIQPSIDLIRDVMTIQANGMSQVEVPLNDESSRIAQVCQSKVCGDRVPTYDCGEVIGKWLSTFLGRKCRLIRQSTSFNRPAGAKKNGLLDATSPSLSLVNEAQYLLVNTASIIQFSQQIPVSNEEKHSEQFNLDEMTQRFRPNLVIDSNIPFQEEAWDEVFIGGLHLQVFRKCTRCLIICINQSTGEKKREVLQALSSSREGKTNFGMYLLNAPCLSYPCMLTVGSEVCFKPKEADPPTLSQDEHLKK
ncbi:molybdenum cofactor sulfurase [Hyperolius riggenbachi]|uniref:molybdenum cofactor sulfurase n=1 Tax=Hyperolius riggenbachi TaxID=752182 RepID=UPI0035A2EB34